MGKREFDNFLNEESNKGDKTVNWEFKLERWKNNVDELYKRLHGWLQEYTETGKIKVSMHEIEIYEEAIGKYLIPSLEILIGDNKVTVKPIGTILIGTIGRVDIIGKSGTQKVILADKNSTGPIIQTYISSNEQEKKEVDEKIKKMADTAIDWEWKLTSNPPRIKYTELNQESFLECLMSVING